jgi:hypothetical protein
VFFITFWTCADPERRRMNRIIAEENARGEIVGAAARMRLALHRTAQVEYIG